MAGWSLEGCPGRQRAGVAARSHPRRAHVCPCPGRLALPAEVWEATQSVLRLTSRRAHVWCVALPGSPLAP